MALSTLLRSTMCINRAVGAQAVRLASRPASLTPLMTRDSNVTTPIINAVRSLSTSAVRLSAKGGDHSRLWVIEKVVSALFLPLIPAALLWPCKALDSVLAVAIVAHTFWGLEAMVIDYARPIVVGHIVPKVAMGLVYFLSIMTLAGLFTLINTCGMACTFKRGFEAIAVDYVRPIIFGPVVPKLAIGLVYAICIATLGGLFYIIQHDVGIANTIRQVWSIKPQQN